MKKLLTLALSALALIGPLSARAADITVTGVITPDGKVEENTIWVEINGDIVAGDEETFHQKTEGYAHAIIDLSSDGGSLSSGLAIGTEIRQRNFVTAVEKGSTCASVCALMWLAGTPRALIAGRPQIGFHAAYSERTGREVGEYNAVVGAYITKLGLDYDAVEYMTQASPDDITWLGPEDAKKLGIQVVVAKDLDEVVGLAQSQKPQQDALVVTQPVQAAPVAQPAASAPDSAPTPTAPTTSNTESTTNTDTIGYIILAGFGGILVLVYKISKHNKPYPIPTNPIKPSAPVYSQYVPVTAVPSTARPAAPSASWFPADCISQPANTPAAPKMPAYDPYLHQLWQNLRLKTLYDDAQIDRLIAYERQRLPNALLEELMESAIDRWERDNR